MWRARFHVRQDTSRSIVYVEGIDVVACTETLSLDSVIQNPHRFLRLDLVLCTLESKGMFASGTGNQLPVPHLRRIRALESRSISSD